MYVTIAIAIVLKNKCRFFFCVRLHTNRMFARLAKSHNTKQRIFSYYEYQVLCIVPYTVIYGERYALNCKYVEYRQQLGSNNTFSSFTM